MQYHANESESQLVFGIFFKPLVLNVKFRVSINRNSKGKDQKAGQKRLRVLSAWKLDSVQTVFETIRTIDLGQYTDLMIYLPEGSGCFCVRD